MALTLVTGPVRSGKSRFARQLADEHSGDVTYVATARSYAGDPEWEERIRRHRIERPEGWRTLEIANLSMGEFLRAIDRCSRTDLLLIDSLGTLLASEFSESTTTDELVESGTELLRTLIESACASIVVSEETGWGIVPEYPSGRRFRDAMGLINQRFAREAQSAYLAVCGYAVNLKEGILIR